MVVLLDHRSAHKPSPKDAVILSHLRRFLHPHTNYAGATRCVCVQATYDAAPWSAFSTCPESPVCLHKQDPFWFDPIGRMPASNCRHRPSVSNAMTQFSRTVRLPIPQAVPLNEFLSSMSCMTNQMHNSAPICATPCSTARRLLLWESDCFDANSISPRAASRPNSFDSACDWALIQDRQPCEHQQISDGLSKNSVPETPRRV